MLKNKLLKNIAVLSAMIGLIIFLPSFVLAQGCPSSTSVSGTSVTFVGEVTDLGGDIFVVTWFEYGTTSSLGSRTSEKILNQKGLYCDTVSGLSPNTTYYYRAAVRNSKYTSYGQIRNFTTHSQTTNPYVETNSASNVSLNSATLNGNLIDLRGASSVNVWFQWGTSISYGQETSHTLKTNPGTFNQTIYNLSPNTTYHFRAVAENNAGISYGGDRTFSTSSQPNNSPFANAGSDKTVNENQSVVLTGSGSDPDGDPLTYRWSCNGGSLSNREIAQPVYTAPSVSQDTYYSCNLTVTDDRGLSDSDTTRILVLDAEEEEICSFSNATCYNPDGNIYPGNYKTGCLNRGDNKFYRVPGSAGKKIKVDLTWSGSGCNLNDLIIYNSSCNKIDGERNNNWVKTWEGVSSSSDVIIGLDGDSSNDNCQWTLRVDEVESEEESRLLVKKSVKNLTRGDTIWYSVGSANPDDRLLFRIKVSSSGNSTFRDVIVKDILPSNIIYSGNLKIDNVSDSRNIISGINLGDILPGQTKTITFEAKAAPENKFIYGTNQLVNTVSARSSDGFSSTGVCKIIVVKTGLARATTVSTGFTNNIFLDFFILPLSLSLLIVWLFRSRIISWSKWIDLRKESYYDYKAKKLLQFKINQIKAKELFKKGFNKTN